MRILKIGFNLSNSENDEEYDASSWIKSEVQIYDERIIGHQLNSFLKQAGYKKFTA